MKNDIYAVLIRPLVTEKGTKLSQTRHAFSFQVNPNANKAQIKQAVEKIYNVRVLEVRTANRKGKPRRAGYRWSETSQWKKAVVVLHPDHNIDLF
ncbi:MAG: 50S ribosomal protein L23 [Phycisphaerae bacterium]|nr:50S ribosomal protein L23 [Phycisphaerae bacterium]